jgi:hypothetical protein
VVAVDEIDEGGSWFLGAVGEKPGVTGNGGSFGLKSKQQEASQLVKSTGSMRGEGQGMNVARMEREFRI